MIAIIAADHDIRADETFIARNRDADDARGRDRLRPANDPTRLVAVQPAATSAAAVTQDRGARDPAAGCAATTAPGPGLSARLVQRPDRPLPRRSRRRRAPAGRTRRLFTRLRQPLIRSGASVVVPRRDCPAPRNGADGDPAQDQRHCDEQRQADRLAKSNC